jgi:hypothetical protein
MACERTRAEALDYMPAAKSGTLRRIGGINTDLARLDAAIAGDKSLPMHVVEGFSPRSLTSHV